MAKEKENFADTHGIPTVTLNEVREQIELGLHSGQLRGVPILVGESGLGKTQIFGQIAKATGRKLITIHTASFNILGTGIPSVKDLGEGSEDFFRIRVPDIFPKESDGPTILLFDEMNRGLQHSINMFFNLLEDRSNFSYRLPDNCMLAGTMNPATGGYNVTDISSEPAVRRRVKFFYVREDAEGFLNHAESNLFHAGSAIDVAKDKPAHAHVLDYFKAKPKRIYDVKARDAGKAYACPANIETVSEDAYILDQAGFELHSSQANIRFSASLNQAVADDLCAFLENAVDVLSPIQVLTDFAKSKRKLKKFSTEKLSELTQNMVAYIIGQRPKVEAIVDGLCSFGLLVPKEYTAALLQGINKGNDLDYTQSLTAVLGNNEQWIPLLHRMQEGMKEFEASLAKKKEDQDDDNSELPF